MTLSFNAIHQFDCVQGMERLAPASVHLAFADPPFNIGYEYDLYDDRQGYQQYLDWSRQWMAAVHRVLKPDGTFWLAIGDEYAAELKLIAQRDIGFTCRSWVIWYYTFGVNCTRKFNRSHAHLFYFTKHSKRFKFNAADPALRVPSARQTVYADDRANPNGRLPDDTWILRPQDVPHGFMGLDDTWYYPRVAGTFKERAGFHGCQMPEQLLGRVIRACSDERDVVLDPFTGSATTLAVAKKLNRQWIGFELSPEYVARARERVDGCSVGQELDGAVDPLASAPATPIAPSRDRSRGTPGRAARARPSYALPAVGESAMAHQAPAPTLELHQVITAAYVQACDGLPSDWVIADPEANAAFVEACRRGGAPGGAVTWNRTLLRLRKSGKLPRAKRGGIRRISRSAMDSYRFASEIALGILSNLGASLDDVLCDPKLVAKFDDIASRFAPGHSPLEYRWAALDLRKRAHAHKKEAECIDRSPRFGRPMSWEAEVLDRLAAGPGLYVLLGCGNEPLYVGETLDLAARIRCHWLVVSRGEPWQGFLPESVITRSHVRRTTTKPIQPIHSWLIGQRQPRFNLPLLGYRENEDPARVCAKC
jgi:site-specific DNA-methyltransferase (adenine-specific)